MNNVGGPVDPGADQPTVARDVHHRPGRPRAAARRVPDPVARAHQPVPEPGLGVVGIVDAADPTCPAGSRNHVTPPVIHIWFVPITGGPTAIDAPDAQVVAAAEQVTSPANGRA